MEQFVAPVGAKIGPVTGTIRTVKSVSGQFGESKLLIVELESGQMVKSFCSGASVLWPYWQAGESVTILGATVKAHEEFRGTPQTVLSRVVVDDRAKREERTARDYEAKKTEVKRFGVGFTAIEIVGEGTECHRSRLLAEPGPPGAETPAEWATRKRFPQLHTAFTSRSAAIRLIGPYAELPPVSIAANGELTEEGRKQVAELQAEGKLVDYGEEKPEEPQGFKQALQALYDKILEGSDALLEGREVDQIGFARLVTQAFTLISGPAEREAYDKAMATLDRLLKRDREQA